MSIVAKCLPRDSKYRNPTLRTVRRLRSAEIPTGGIKSEIKASLKARSSPCSTLSRLSATSSGLSSSLENGPLAVFLVLKCSVEHLNELLAIVGVGVVGV